VTRIPVHIVTGAPGTGKTAFIARLCAEREDWLGLVNLASSPGAGPNLKPLAAGCPCCTGKVVLQVTLARALRATGAGRAFVELGDAGHLQGLERALGESPLDLSLVISRSISLPRDAGLPVAEFER
jgi:CobW/HypB/UreG, nucleotide-binding domain